jgi:TonB family protein
MHLQKMRRRPIEPPPTTSRSPRAATSPRPGMLPSPPPPPPDDPADMDMYRGAVRLSPVRGGVKGPRKIAHVDPIYPPEAAAQNVRGAVIVEARIEPDGRVSRVRVLNSIPLLDQAALDAVRQWLFEPPMIDGQPVPIIMMLTVPFMQPASY